MTRLGPNTARLSVAAAIMATPGLAVAQPDGDALPPDEPPPPVSAADGGATPASTEERAAAAFERGRSSFLGGEYEDALAAFEEAQRLAPHDVVRFNIALCHERLGHLRLALGEYEHAAASEQLDEANRTEATERVRARLGTLVVGGPAGATIEVVGVETCTAPCRVTVDPGPVQVRQVGTPGEVRSVTVAGGEERRVEFADQPVVTTSSGSGLRLHVGLVGWIGAGAALVGAVGTIAFGLRAELLHARYLDNPTVGRRDSGRTAVALTNVSLVLAVLGAAALAVGEQILERRAEPTASRDTLAFAF